MARFIASTLRPSRIAMLILLCSLLAPSNARAMAVANWFSGWFGSSTEDPGETPPKDIVDQQDCKDCQQGIKEPAINDIFDSANDIGNQINEDVTCNALDVGKSRVLNIPWHKSPTKIEHKYALKRTSEKEYEATLNIKFENGHEDNSASIVSEMRARVQKCFSIASKKLLGPNGSKITLRLQETGDGYTPRAPEVTVKIDKADVRSDSGRYAADASCSTILHESLHLMGLVDEYEEEVSSTDKYYSHYKGDVPSTSAEGYTTDRNGHVSRTEKEDNGNVEDSCRAPGPADSIMSSHWDAWKKSFGSNYEYVCTCVGGSSLSRCAKSLESIQPKDLIYNGSPVCPSGSSGSLGKLLTSEQDTSFDSFGGVSPVTITEKSKLMVRYQVQSGRPKDGASLLYPAHFNSLIFPGCTLNQTYYLCSLDASNATPKGTRVGCKNQTPPRACANGSTDWIQAPGK